MKGRQHAIARAPSRPEERDHPRGCMRPFHCAAQANSSAPDRVEKHTRLKVRAIEFFGDVSLGSLTVDGISPLGDMGFRVAQHTEYVRAPPGILQLLRRARMDWKESCPARSSFPQIEE